MHRVLSLTLALGGSLAAAQPVAVIFGKAVHLKDLVPAAELAAQRKLLAADPLAAWLAKAQCDALQGRIWQAVFDDYVQTSSLRPTKQEIAACARWNQADAAKSWDPRDGPVPLDRQLAAEMLGAWKRDVALYREYGGRMIFQQHGLEPIDAWRKLLEKYQARGAFTVSDPKLSGCVYQYFELTFFDAGEAATRRFLSRSMCSD